MNWFYVYPFKIHAPMLPQNLTKAERLCKKKDIQELFKKGSFFYLYPLKVVYLKKDNQTLPHSQVLFSVPKKYFKRAVDRNQLKRRLREAYRRNKFIIADQQAHHIAYIYIGKEISPFKEIELKLISSLERFNE